MSDNKYIEYTKEQCLYALKRSIKECRINIGENGTVMLATDVALGIYNYLSDDEKLYIEN